ncbi:MAG: hypothetical protein IK121_03060, partial [Lachnospiraceae bacterium]|nr:hypothetical protein [Lachnospiraceae bacterium]
MEFYSAVVYIQVLSAIALAIVIWSNPILDNDLKTAFSVEFGLLAVASVCSFMADMLDGTKDSLLPFHCAMKILEF